MRSMLSRCGCDRIRAFLQPGTDLLRPLTPDSAPLPPRRTWKRWCAERKPSRTPIRSILQRHWGRWLRRMPCSGYSDTLTPRSPRARLRSLAARAHWSRPAATPWDPPFSTGVSPDEVRRSRRSSALSWCSFRSTPWKRPSPLPMEFRSGRRRRCGPRTRPLRT